MVRFDRMAEQLGIGTTLHKLRHYNAIELLPAGVDLRTVAVEANPRAISQMPNVSSNNPPGMELTSAAPATPNSSSRLPPAKHA
jgi:hypothetical protein